MTIIGWLILGGIAGFIASMIIDKSGKGLLIDIVLGIVGAVIGGYVYAARRGSGHGLQSVQHVRCCRRRCDRACGLSRCDGPRPTI